MTLTLKDLLRNMGPLRIALYILIIANFPVSPSSLENVTSLDAEAIITGMLMPVFAPILFMLVMLDSIVSRIYMSDKQGTERSLYKTIVIWDIFLGICMLFKWLPFFFTTLL